MNTKELRKIHKLSQRQLSKLTHIPVKTIQQWELKNNAKPWIIYILTSWLAFLEETGEIEKFKETL